MSYLEGDSLLKEIEKNEQQKLMGKLLESEI